MTGRKKSTLKRECLLEVIIVRGSAICKKTCGETVEKFQNDFPQRTTVKTLHILPSTLPSTIYTTIYHLHYHLPSTLPSTIYTTIYHLQKIQRLWRHLCAKGLYSYLYSIFEPLGSTALKKNNDSVM